MIPCPFSCSWTIIGAIVLLILFTAGVLFIFYPAFLVSHAPRYSLRTIFDPDKKRSKTTTKKRLSIIIPAWNEQDRLGPMLKAMCAYLATWTNIMSEVSIEILLVDDGSTDNTKQVYTTFAKSTTSLPITYKYIQLEQNTGKGAAIRTGMLVACQEEYPLQQHYCLMVDADGATNVSTALPALLQHISPQTPIVFGSRAHLQDKRHVIRHLLMLAFHFFVRHLTCTTDIKDTQCGFKLFEASVARQLFENQRLQRWAFDTELVVLARKFFHFDICEVPVDWREVEGSKLNTSAWTLAWVAITMLRDMICVRLCYELGIWKIKRKSS